MSYAKSEDGWRAVNGPDDCLPGEVWQAEQPSVVFPNIVTVVTMRQCQLALLAAGLLDQVDALIATQAREVRITWATAGTVERSNPLIESLAQALGLSDAQVDELFEQAALL